MTTEGRKKIPHTRDDLFSIFVNKRDRAKRRGSGNSFVSFALFAISWEAYLEALFDFGIINEEELVQLMRLINDYP